MENMTISEALRQAILTSGTSQAEIARQTGIPAPNISDFVQGRTTLNLTTADRIASVLGLRLMPVAEKKKG